LQFHALRYLPAQKSDSGFVIQGVTVSQRRGQNHLLLLFSEQELQFAPQRLGGWQFIHVHDYYVSVVKHRRCAAALSLPALKGEDSRANLLKRKWLDFRDRILCSKYKLCQSLK
jgi:hypothetical protein